MSAFLTDDEIFGLLQQSLRDDMRLVKAEPGAAGGEKPRSPSTKPTSPKDATASAEAAASGKAAGPGKQPGPAPGGTSIKPPTETVKTPKATAAAKGQNTIKQTTGIGSTPSGMPDAEKRVGMNSRSKQGSLDFGAETPRKEVTAPTASAPKEENAPVSLSSKSEHKEVSSPVSSAMTGAPSNNAAKPKASTASDWEKAIGEKGRYSMGRVGAGGRTSYSHTTSKLAAAPEKGNVYNFDFLKEGPSKRIIEVGEVDHTHDWGPEKQGQKGKITFKDRSTGETKAVSRNEWHQMMQGEFGDAYVESMDKGARAFGRALYKHIPAEMLHFDPAFDQIRNSGDTAQIVSFLKNSTNGVYQGAGKKLERALKSAGVYDEGMAKELIGFTLTRRGWSPEAKAALLGAAMSGYETARIAKNYKKIALMAEKAAGRGTVTDATIAKILRDPGMKLLGITDHQAQLRLRQEKKLNDFNEQQRTVGGKTFDTYDELRDHLRAEKAKENPKKVREIPNFDTMTDEQYEDWKKEHAGKLEGRLAKMRESFFDAADKPGEGSGMGTDPRSAEEVQAEVEDQQKQARAAAEEEFKTKDTRRKFSAAKYADKIRAAKEVAADPMPDKVDVGSIDKASLQKEADKYKKEAESATDDKVKATYQNMAKLLEVINNASADLSVDEAVNQAFPDMADSAPQFVAGWREAAAQSILRHGGYIPSVASKMFSSTEKTAKTEENATTEEPAVEETPRTPAEEQGATPAAEEGTSVPAEDADVENAAQTEEGPEATRDEKLAAASEAYAKYTPDMAYHQVESLADEIYQKKGKGKWSNLSADDLSAYVDLMDKAIAKRKDIVGNDRFSRDASRGGGAWASEAADKVARAKEALTKLGGDAAISTPSASKLEETRGRQNEPADVALARDQLARVDQAIANLPEGPDRESAAANLERTRKAAQAKVQQYEQNKGATSKHTSLARKAVNAIQQLVSLFVSSDRASEKSADLLDAADKAAQAGDKVGEAANTLAAAVIHDPANVEEILSNSPSEEATLHALDLLEEAAPELQGNQQEDTNAASNQDDATDESPGSSPSQEPEPASEPVAAPATEEVSEPVAAPSPVTEEVSEPVAALSPVTEEVSEPVVASQGSAALTDADVRDVVRSVDTHGEDATEATAVASLVHHLADGASPEEAVRETADTVGEAETTAGIEQLNAVASESNNDRLKAAAESVSAVSGDAIAEEVSAPAARTSRKKQDKGKEAAEEVSAPAARTSRKKQDKGKEAAEEARAPVTRTRKKKQDKAREVSDVATPTPKKEDKDVLFLESVVGSPNTAEAVKKAAKYLDDLGANEQGMVAALQELGLSSKEMKALDIPTILSGSSVEERKAAFARALISVGNRSDKVKRAIGGWSPTSVTSKPAAVADDAGDESGASAEEEQNIQEEVSEPAEKPVASSYRLAKKAADRVEELLLDPGTTKKQVASLARKMKEAGLLTDTEYMEAARVYADKDMSAEDVLDELRVALNRKYLDVKKGDEEVACVF